MFDTSRRPDFYFNKEMVTHKRKTNQNVQIKYVRIWVILRLLFLLINHNCLVPHSNNIAIVNSQANWSLCVCTIKSWDVCLTVPIRCGFLEVCVLQQLFVVVLFISCSSYLVTLFTVDCRFLFHKVISHKAGKCVPIPRKTEVFTNCTQFE